MANGYYMGIYIPNNGLRQSENILHAMHTATPVEERWMPHRSG